MSEEQDKRLVYGGHVYQVTTIRVYSDDTCDVRIVKVLAISPHVNSKPKKPGDVVNAKFNKVRDLD